MDDFALEVPRAGVSFPEKCVEERLPSVAEVFRAGEEDDGGIAKDFGVMDFGGLRRNSVFDVSLTGDSAAHEGEHLVGGELDEAASVCYADTSEVSSVGGCEAIDVGGVGCRQKRFDGLAEAGVGYGFGNFRGGLGRFCGGAFQHFSAEQKKDEAEDEIGEQVCGNAANGK